MKLFCVRFVVSRGLTKVRWHSRVTKEIRIRKENSFKEFFKSLVHCQMLEVGSYPVNISVTFQLTLLAFPVFSIKNQEDTFFIEFLCEEQKLFKVKERWKQHSLSSWHWRTAQWILMRLYVNIVMGKYAAVAFINPSIGDPSALTHSLPPRNVCLKGFIGTFFSSPFLKSNLKHLKGLESWRMMIAEEFYVGFNPNSYLRVSSLQFQGNSKTSFCNSERRKTFRRCNVWCF